LTQALILQAFHARFAFRPNKFKAPYIFAPNGRAIFWIHLKFLLGKAGM
jgi:hypothetical protein